MYDCIICGLLFSLLIINVFQSNWKIYIKMLIILSHSTQFSINFKLKPFYTLLINYIYIYIIILEIEIQLILKKIKFDLNLIIIRC